MKEDMVCIGIKVIDDDTMQLELVPLLKNKKKSNITELAMQGKSRELIKAIQGEQQHRHIIFRDREWCIKKQIIPFCSMTLDIDTSDNHKQRTGT